MSYVHSKFIRLRGYYQFYPLVRIKSIWKHILSAVRDKRCDIRIADKREALKPLKSAILSRMPSRHAAYTVYQLYFTPSMP
ncbi:hypothetical protein F2M96_08565 [Escherichia coli]|nr:hypothetical protein [Escherichia coli]